MSKFNAQKEAAADKAMKMITKKRKRLKSRAQYTYNNHVIHVSYFEFQINLSTWTYQWEFPNLEREKWQKWRKFDRIDVSKSSTMIRIRSAYSLSSVFKCILEILLQNHFEFSKNRSNTQWPVSYNENAQKHVKYLYNIKTISIFKAFK